MYRKTLNVNIQGIVSTCKKSLQRRTKWEQRQITNEYTIFPIVSIWNRGAIFEKLFMQSFDVSLIEVSLFTDGPGYTFVSSILFWVTQSRKLCLFPVE